MDKVNDYYIQDGQPRELEDVVVYLTTILTIGLFIAVNEIIARLAPKYVGLKVLSQWRTRNLAVSWMHAVISAIWCCYCYYTYWNQLRSFSAMVDYISDDSRLLVAFSSGYFLYDIIDYGREGKLITNWEVLAHHVGILSIFCYNQWYHFAVPFCVVALSVENNSVFLHGRKLLQMFGVPFSHWLYRMTMVLNLITFAIFRGQAMVLIWLGFLLNLHRCTVPYALALAVIMVFMGLLNIIFFWRLLKSDILRSRKRKLEGKTTASGSDALSEQGREAKLMRHNDDFCSTTDKDVLTPRNGFGILRDRMAKAF